MKLQYQGDSYDHVKRVLLATAGDAPWVTAAMMTDETTIGALREYAKFLQTDVPTQFVTMPQRDERPSYFQSLRQHCRDAGANVFLDPCTGVRPATRFRPSMREHVSTSEIVDLLSGGSHPLLLLCFDQSMARGSEDESRSEKLSLFHQAEVRAFYFRSHASFLCASLDGDALDKWHQNMRDVGLPESRFQHYESE